MSETVKLRIFAFLSAIIFFVLGGLMLTRPGATLTSLIWVMGIMLIITGIFLVVDGWRLPSVISYRVPYILDGVLATLLGLIFVFGNSLINITALSYLLILWIIVSSLVQIYVGWIVGGWLGILTIILDVIVIVLSIMALLDPVLAQGVLIWYMAFQFIFMGVTRLFIAFDPDLKVTVSTTKKTVSSTKKKK